MGNVLRIVVDSHHCCGQLVEISSHVGTHIMGQSVFRNNLKYFLSMKAPHQIIVDASQVVDLAKIKNPDPKGMKGMKF